MNHSVSLHRANRAILSLNSRFREYVVLKLTGKSRSLCPFFTPRSAYAGMVFVVRTGDRCPHDASSNCYHCWPSTASPSISLHPHTWDNKHAPARLAKLPPQRRLTILLSSSARSPYLAAMGDAWPWRWQGEPGNRGSVGVVNKRQGRARDQHPATSSRG
jgi:hypothetical protein